MPTRRGVRYTQSTRMSSRVFPPAARGWEFVSYTFRARTRGFPVGGVAVVGGRAADGVLRRVEREEVARESPSVQVVDGAVYYTVLISRTKIVRLGKTPKW